MGEGASADLAALGATALPGAFVGANGAPSFWAGYWRYLGHSWHMDRDLM